MKLHDGELDISADLVRGLLRRQFPRWASLSLTPVAAAGTDNVMFRLGEDLVIRLPRMPGSVATILKENRWLPWLAPQLPLAIPSPVGLGEPGEGYPLPWSISRWLPGNHDISDLSGAATALGDFVAALQRVEVVNDAPPAYRGGSYASWDDGVRAALRDLDVPGASHAWEAALRLPAWDGPPVWLHSDLLPPNLLAAGGQLHAVIDFGCAGVGDPACDLMPAWTVFDETTRPLFRARLTVDDASWERGRAWALAFGLAAWHYYEERNPPFAALGRRTVNQTLTNTASST